MSSDTPDSPVGAPFERVSEEVVEFVAAFDGLDRDGQPYFDADHPAMSRDEADRVLAWLRSAPVVSEGRGLAPDWWDGGKPDRVPTGFRTDGTYVWPEAVAWYLDRHGLRPDERLVSRAMERAAFDADADAVREALYELGLERRPLPPPPKVRNRFRFWERSRGTSAVEGTDGK